MIVFIRSSEKIRKYYWKAVNGPFCFIGLANKTDHHLMIKIFEALVVWSKVDTIKIEEFLSDGENIQSLFKLVFPKQKILSVQQYIDILPFVKEIIKISPRVASVISRREQIIVSIANQITGILSSDRLKKDIKGSHSSDKSSKNSGQFYNQSSSQKGVHGGPYNPQDSKNLVWALQEILELILLIAEQAQIQLKEFITAYGMDKIIMKTYHTAKAEGLHKIKEL